MDLVQQKENKRFSPDWRKATARLYSGATRGWITLRWLVLLLLGVLFSLFEINSHYGIQKLYSLDHPLYQDVHMIREIFLFGIVYPLLTGILLTYLERTIVERNRINKFQEKRLAFVKRLNDASDLEQLVETIVRLPSVFFEATGSYLLLQMPWQENLNLTSWWDNIATLSMPQFMIDDCRGCITTYSSHPQLHSSCLECDYLPSLPDNLNRYCFPLNVSKETIGTLVFYVLKDKPINDKDSRALTDLLPEIGLALTSFKFQSFDLDPVEIQANERKRIARDLHDTLGQNISYLRLKLDQLSIQDSLGDIIEIQKDLRRMRDIADEAYNQMRNALTNLQSPSGTGLLIEFKELIGAYNNRAKFTIRFKSTGIPKSLPENITKQVLYVTREVLNNVEKHANAQKVDMNLVWGQDKLVITIQDDGVGFYSDNVAKSEHYGLIFMKERVQEIGGNINFTSTPNQGTKISIRIPFSYENIQTPV